ncbi:hypothetical protein [Rhizobium sp. BK251]|uniref:hypothetical protein n=1 Tax=Rhizobium sp. BK251 TaxID=2512125 RepID=UPI0010505873|nr:hypothetical protein [Rhizobium sp. BK251]TCL74570.1 hypothetical protein EV286_102130 [Rhizobium sp. BK251]
MRPFENTVLDTGDSRIGTRFWIFPQPPFIPGYEQPDRVWLSIPPDEIGEGPSDRLMYVVDPLINKEPYGLTQLPPFEGTIHPPARSGPDGNFDNLDPTSRAFLGAHAYACVHFTLDVWQNYLGHPIRWFFSEVYPRLEIIPFVDWDNAQAGYGFLELGACEVGKVLWPYALNFDCIAHEVGHLISFSEIGFPVNAAADADYFPYSEAFADSISLVSMLHFESAIDRLLRRTRGDLLLQNELNRFAEKSPETQIRLASNTRRMSEVSREPHDRSLPFLGAIFDSLVELYHGALVASGCASPRLLQVDIRDLELDEFDKLRAEIADAFRLKPGYFNIALATARDQIGQALANSLKRIDPDTLRLEQAAAAIIAAADAKAAAQLEENFAWREIIR